MGGIKINNLIIKDQFKFDNCLKEIYNLLYLLLAVGKNADDPIWLPKHVGEISQGAVEKYGWLIYVNVNELSYWMMRTRRVGQAGLHVATAAEWKMK